MRIFSSILLLLTVHAAARLATPVRVADAPCEKCHRAIYRSYLLTPMANASGLAAERFIPGKFEHRASGVEYTISESGGTPVLSYRDLRDPSVSGHWPLTYFLGSGHLGTTWLYSLNHYLFESPVAWYAASGGYDMKPGLEEATEMLPSLPMESGCLRCHMSAVQPTDADTMNRYSSLPFLHAGITCEACHGDTTQHVLSGGKAPVVNPARLDPERRDSVCISCHLEGDVSVERAGHSVLDYRPGESISEYLAYYVYAKSNPLARGVSEVEQLSQSTCKRMSGDKMSCTSCHDPHYRPAPQQRAAFYRAKCLTCHTAPGFAESHHPENPDCTSCHMPHAGAQNIPHVAWTDHRILRQPDLTPTDTAPEPERQLVPIFSPGATSRDLGMAYYKAVLEGNRAVEPQAWSLLRSEQQEIVNDRTALDALGILSAERGDDQTAESSFRRVLTLDPADLTALPNMATLLARQGEIPQAVLLLRRAFARNQDIGGLAMNLARAECMTGDITGAQSTLQKALVYNAGVGKMRRLLDQAGECGTSGQKVGKP